MSRSARLTAFMKVHGPYTSIPTSALIAAPANRLAGSVRFITKPICRKTNSNTSPTTPPSSMTRFPAARALSARLEERQILAGLGSTHRLSQASCDRSRKTRAQLKAAGLFGVVTSDSPARVPLRRIVFSMEYLSALDAGFLEVEDTDPHVSLAVGALAVLAGPMPEFAPFAAGLGERLAKVPRFKQVLHAHLLDLGAPAWVDDVAFDLSHHVRRAAVPQPGDDEALFRLAATLMERRLDRDHPLWECWMIEGLEGGRWAILMKIHHCIADGIATIQLLARLSDEGGDDMFVSEIHAVTGSQNGAHLPQFTLNPRDWIGGMWRTSAAVAGAATRAFEGMLEIGAALVRPAESSALSGPVTGMRRYDAVRVPLDDVTKICKAYDVTINDVALAVITDSYRAALIRRGEQPRARSLRTLVPVSVRSNDALDEVNNRVSLMLPYLPVEEPDPVRQLQAVHSRLTQAKRSGQRQAGSWVVSATNLVPFAVTAWTMRALTRLPQRAVVTVATNVPGPRRRLRVMGQPVIRLLPILPIALQVRTGIAILSYADELVFGITGDYDAASDVNELATGIERAAARLTSLSTTPRSSSPSGKRALKDARLASNSQAGE